MAEGKSGYIFKEGEKFMSWRKRFFCIERDKLSYYTKENKKLKKGEILVRTIKEVKRFREYKSRKFVFGIVTTTGRTYYCQASDEASCASWVAAINQLVAPSPASSNTGSSSASPATIHNTTASTRAPTPTESHASSGGNVGQSEVAATKMTVDDFDQLKVIGRGGFGKVLLVKKKDTCKVYAMKILNKSVIAARGEIEHTRTERNVLSKLTHPFLAKLHYSFQTPEQLYFIMDFINGGELFHHLSREKRFSENRARFYAAQIISGMMYLHSAGVIYRDLKPENLLLSAHGNIVMTDFGLSKEGLNAANSRTATFCGTPEYLAPEIIKGDEYTKAIDWWSVGTLIYEMLTGLPPFYTEDEENMYHKIMTADLVMPSFFSPEVGDLIHSFLKREPTERLQDHARIKAHPWFRDIDWQKLDNLELPPPFVPNVRSSDDVQNIDDEFLNEDVHDKSQDQNDPTGEVKKEDFIGFTYNEE